MNMADDTFGISWNFQSFRIRWAIHVRDGVRPDADALVSDPAAGAGRCPYRAVQLYRSYWVGQGVDVRRRCAYLRYLDLLFRFRKMKRTSSWKHPHRKNPEWNTLKPKDAAHSIWFPAYRLCECLSRNFPASTRASEDRASESPGHQFECSTKGKKRGIWTNENIRNIKHPQKDESTLANASWTSSQIRNVICTLCWQCDGIHVLCEDSGIQNLLVIAEIQSSQSIQEEEIRNRLDELTLDEAICCFVCSPPESKGLQLFTTYWRERWPPSLSRQVNSVVNKFTAIDTVDNSSQALWLQGVKNA